MYYMQIATNKALMPLILPNSAYHNPPEKGGSLLLWDSQLLLTHLQAQHPDISLRAVERAINTEKLLPTSLKVSEVRDKSGLRLNELVRDNLEETAKSKRQTSLIIQYH